MSRETRLRSVAVLLDTAEFAQRSQVQILSPLQEVQVRARFVFMTDRVFDLRPGSVWANSAGLSSTATDLSLVSRDMEAVRRQCRGQYSPASASRPPGSAARTCSARGRSCSRA